MKLMQRFSKNVANAYSAKSRDAENNPMLSSYRWEVVELETGGNKVNRGTALTSAII